MVVILSEAAEVSDSARFALVSQIRKYLISYAKISLRIQMDAGHKIGA